MATHYARPNHSTLEPPSHQPWRMAQGTDLESQYPYGDDTLNGMEVVREEGRQVVCEDEDAKAPTEAQENQTLSRRRLCGIPLRIAITLLLFLVVGGIIGGAVGGVLGARKNPSAGAEINTDSESWVEPAENKWYTITTDPPPTSALDAIHGLGFYSRNLSHTGSPNPSSSSYHFGFRKIPSRSSEDKQYYLLTHRKAPPNHTPGSAQMIRQISMLIYWK